MITSSRFGMAHVLTAAVFVIALGTAVYAIPHEHAEGSVILYTQHFDELVGEQDGSQIVSKHTVLVLHNTSCPPEIERSLLPSVKYLYFVTYDLQETPQYVWFEDGPAGKLQDRYPHNRQACQTYLFLRKGSHIKSRPEVWDSQTDLLTWIWDKVKNQLLVKNQLEDELRIESSGHLDLVNGEAVLPPGREAMVFCFPGITVIFKTRDRIIYVGIAGGQDGIVAIDNTLVSPNIADIYRNEEESKEFHARWLYTTGQRHLLAIKQAQFVHNYTQTGFKKLKMPDLEFKKIKEWFKDNYNSMQREPITDVYEVVNMRRLQPTLIDLGELKKMEIAEWLRPLLEEWCQCQLRYTVGYGIREYYQGNILYSHVDRVATHVISAILNIDQDLLADDWPLEVITYNGTRINISMDVGDMVFYESAKLIHGRPTLFQGRRYANAFFHFRPDHGWRYHNYGHGVAYNDYKILESGDLLRNRLLPHWPLYVNESIIYPKDEL